MAHDVVPTARFPTSISPIDVEEADGNSIDVEEAGGGDSREETEAAAEDDAFLDDNHPNNESLDLDEDTSENDNGVTDDTNANKDATYRCRGCPLEFPTKKKLYRHRSHWHPREFRLYTCTICQYCLYNWQANMVRHIVHTHKVTNEDDPMKEHEKWFTVVITPNPERRMLPDLESHPFRGKARTDYCLKQYVKHESSPKKSEFVLSRALDLSNKKKKR